MLENGILRFLGGFWRILGVAEIVELLYCTGNIGSFFEKIGAFIQF
jgi:hypothetical protein